MTPAPGDGTAGAPRRLDLRLAAPVTLAWLLLASCLPVSGAPLPAGVACGGAALAIAWIAIVRGDRPPRRWAAPLPLVALALAAAALLLLATAAKTEQRRPELLLDAAHEGRHVVATAVLTQTVHAGTARFAATLMSATVAGAEHPVTVPMVIFGSSEAPAPIGARIEVSGTLAANGPADAASFLLFADAPVTIDSVPAGILEATGALRLAFLELASELPAPGGNLLPGLAIGDTSAINEELDEAMKRGSLSHLTAVSGANCAVVVGIMLALGGALRLPRWGRIATAAVALAGFVILVTPEPSVLRAGVMAIAVLLAQLSGRHPAGVPVLALAVLVLLAVDPWLALSFGFILSVLATAGLLILSRPLAAVLARLMPAGIAAVLAIPLAAQLACQPVIILLEPSIPVYGVVANLLAGPAAPVATVLGLLACLLAPVATLPAQLLAWLAWLPSSWISGVAFFFAGLPGSQLPWAEGAPGALLAVGGTILALVAVLGRARPARSAATVVLVLCLVVALGLAAGKQLGRRLSMPPDWQIAQCDVGQGDAVILRSAGRIALIDTGPDPALLLECLDLLGVQRLQLLVLTHFDLDHVGGLAAVIGRVDAVLVGPPGGADDARLVDALRRGGATVTTATRGLTGTLGDHRWTALWPPTGASSPEPGNQASVVLAVEPAGECLDGCLSSVLLGDLGEESQRRMLATSRALPVGLRGVDVVKVAHHGSADQSAQLYEALGARVGLIGVGAENDYGHPNQRILDVLDGAGTTVFRSDRHGLVLVAPAGGGAAAVWRERD